MSTVTLNVGKNIKRFRKEKHLTMEELASVICKSKSTLSKYEHGTIAVDIDTLYDIAKALGISVSKLLDIPEEWLYQDVADRPEWPSLLYLYLVSCSNSYFGVLRVMDNNEVRLFFNPKSSQNYTESCSVYDGKIYTHTNMSQFVLFDQDSGNDSMLLSIINTHMSRSFFIGECICATLPPQPVACKCIVSKARLPKSVIQKYLSMTDWEKRTIRKSGTLRIDPGLQYDVEGITSQETLE